MPRGSGKRHKWVSRDAAHGLSATKPEQMHATLLHLRVLLDSDALFKTCPIIRPLACNAKEICDLVLASNKASKAVIRAGLFSWGTNHFVVGKGNYFWRMFWKGSVYSRFSKQLVCKYANVPQGLIIYFIWLYNPICPLATLDNILPYFVSTISLLNILLLLRSDFSFWWTIQPMYEIKSQQMTFRRFSATNFFFIYPHY